MQDIEDGQELVSYGVSDEEPLNSADRRALDDAEPSCSAPPPAKRQRTPDRADDEATSAPGRAQSGGAPARPAARREAYATAVQQPALWGLAPGNVITLVTDGHTDRQRAALEYLNQSELRESLIATRQLADQPEELFSCLGVVTDISRLWGKRKPTSAAGHLMASLREVMHAHSRDDVSCAIALADVLARQLPLTQADKVLEDMRGSISRIVPDMFSPAVINGLEDHQLSRPALTARLVLAITGEPDQALSAGIASVNGVLALRANSQAREQQQQQRQPRQRAPPQPPQQQAPRQQEQAPPQQQQVLPQAQQQQQPPAPSQPQQPAPPQVPQQQQLPPAQQAPVTVQAAAVNAVASAVLDNVPANLARRLTFPPPQPQQPQPPQQPPPPPRPVPAQQPIGCASGPHPSIAHSPQPAFGVSPPVTPTPMPGPPLQQPQQAAHRAHLHAQLRELHNGVSGLQRAFRHEIGSAFACINNLAVALGFPPFQP
jgi:hypothetical protein